MIYLYLFGTCFHFIYVFMIIGKERFEHYEFIEISSYLMVNKKECSDIERKKDRIKETLLNLYDIDS